MQINLPIQDMCGSELSVCLSVCLCVCVFVCLIVCQSFGTRVAVSDSPGRLSVQYVVNTVFLLVKMK